MAVLAANDSIVLINFSCYTVVAYHFVVGFGNVVAVAVTVSNITFVLE